MHLEASVIKEQYSQYVDIINWLYNQIFNAYYYQ